jgi:hypothetical protein
VILLRTLEEIISKALENTLKILNDKPTNEMTVKKTGNKKAIHQKSKNRRALWK